MRKLIPLAVLCGLLAVTATAFAAKTIPMGDNWFVRSSGVPTVAVNKGTTVVWRNRGNVAHNVVVVSGPRSFRSAPVRAGRSYSKRVTVRGTYTIVCTIHGAADQKMKLRVR